MANVGNNRRGRAFTLAEVLFVLSITGVVAAMTVPALMSNIGQKGYVTTWRKTYSELSQATIAISNEYGSFEAGKQSVYPQTYNKNISIKNLYKKKLKYIKECENNNDAKCWHDKVKYLNGGETDYYDPYPSLILSNGALVSFDGYLGPNCDNNICALIWVDVNGFKAPNTFGKDIFQLYVRPNSKLAPEGNGTVCTDNGKNCSAYYLIKDK